MTKPATHAQLLIVDADNASRIFLRRRLSGLGYAVTEATGHAEALSEVAAKRFDLALVDLRTMGPHGASGFDLVSRLRERLSPAELVVVGIGEEAAREDAADALERGADDCLLRPLYIDVLNARVGMLLGHGIANLASRPGNKDLDARLDSLENAAVRTEALAAGIEALGMGRAPINGLLGATAVLTRICRTPALGRAIERIDTAAAALDLVMVQALGFGDRRDRAPKPKLRVLVADRDGTAREALRKLTRTAEVEVDLVEATDGSGAIRATDSGFFDLIVMDLAARGAMAAIETIRKAERQNKVRRTPLLAVGTDARNPLQAREFGCDLYMQHPVNAERLLSALADALTRDSEDVRAVA